MIRVAALDYADAMRARGSKFCQGCRGTKVRDIEPLCKKCIAKLPETIQNALKDSRLYPAAYKSAVKILKALL